MAMSPRLLRPIASGVHPEANDWRSRVVANGGSVSALTMKAVSTFCGAIEKFSIRDRFFRLNLFCGNSDASLNAVRTPLYRGQSLGGTQFGNALDTNNSFVQGDYNETGATGGLLGNGSTKHLNTGFATNTLSAGNRHLSAYETIRSGATFDRFMGSETAASVGAQVFMLGYGSTSNQVGFGFGAFSASLVATASTVASHYIGINSSAGNGAIFRNGVQDTTGSTTASTPTGSSIFVFALNRANTGSAADAFGGRLGSYSIGLAMTAGQAASYYTALQAFQASLTRNV